MTARNEDPNYLVWLRQLQARVSKIESGAGTKQNNIRLGDWVCYIDDAGCLVSNNVKTGEQTITCAEGVGAIEEIAWSCPGAIDQDFIDSALTDGPVWYPPSTIVVVEVGMFLRDNTMISGDRLGVKFITHGSDNIAEVNIAFNAVDLQKSYQTPPAMGPIFDANSTYCGEWFAATPDLTITKNEQVSIELSHAEGLPTSLGNDLTAVLRYRFV